LAEALIPGSVPGARDLGIPSETLRLYVRRLEADQGPGLPAGGERDELKRLRKENGELRRANEILKAASVFFRRN
jgi:transposase